MARLPLVPKPSAVGALALMLFLMTLVGTGLYLSYAGRTMSAEEQYVVLATAAALLVVLGGLAWVFFLRPRARRE